MRQITFIILLFLFIHEGYSQQDTIYTYVFFEIGKKSDEKPDEKQKEAQRMLKDNFDVYFHEKTSKCEQIFRLFKKDNVQEAMIEQRNNKRGNNQEANYNSADFYMKGTIAKYTDYYAVTLEAIGFNTESKGSAITTINPSLMDNLDAIKSALDTLMKQLTNDSKFCSDCNPFQDTSDRRINYERNIKTIKKFYATNPEEKDKTGELRVKLDRNMRFAAKVAYDIVIGHFFQRKGSYANASYSYKSAKKNFCSSNNHDKEILDKLKRRGVIRFNTNDYSAWLDDRIKECGKNITNYDDRKK